MMNNEHTPVTPETVKEAHQALFPDKEKSNRHRNLGVGAAAVGLGIGASFLVSSGIDVAAALDYQFVPEPTVLPEIVDGLVAVNESLRHAAPSVMAAGLGASAYYWMKARTSTSADALRRMSQVDYSSAEQSGKNQQKRRRGITNSIGGVAVLTVLLTGGSSGVEHEVSNGALRPVEQVFDIASEADIEGTHIALQNESITFMDDSYITTDDVNSLILEASDEDIDAMPINLSLPNIDERSGIVISVPDKIMAASVDEPIDTSCENIPVILDEANTKNIGETVEINNIEAQVVEKVEGTAQMNRDVAIMSRTDHANCVELNDDANYYGVLLSMNEGQEKALMSNINDTELNQNISIVEREAFEQSNLSFWRKNGTPILLQMIAYIGAFGAFATASERRAAFQRNIREIGTLRAQGVQSKDIAKIEVMRALRETRNATIVAAPIMPLFVGLFNAAEVGLKVGVGIREIAVGYSVTAAAKIGGALRSSLKFNKKLDLADSIKG